MTLTPGLKIRGYGQKILYDSVLKPEKGSSIKGNLNGGSVGTAVFQVALNMIDKGVF